MHMSVTRAMATRLPKIAPWNRCHSKLFGIEFRYFYLWVSPGKEHSQREQTQGDAAGYPVEADGHLHDAAQLRHNKHLENTKYSHYSEVPGRLGTHQTETDGSIRYRQRFRYQSAFPVREVYPESSSEEVLHRDRCQTIQSRGHRPEF